MKLKDKYITLIKLKAKEGAKISLGNDVEAELIDVNGKIMASTDYGVLLELDRLNLEKIKSFCKELGIEERKDYVVLTDNTNQEFVCFLKFQTREEIKQRTEELKNNIGQDLLLLSAEELELTKI